MAENKELSKIERDLVLQYLRDDNVPVTVIATDKPPAQEVELMNGKNEATGERLPMGFIFPVAVPAEQLTVLDKGIILLKKNVRDVLPFVGHSVKVQFFFNKLGLYFITTMKETSQGPALVVPNSIYRMKENVTQHPMDVKATLLYKDGSGKDISVKCIQKESYELFVQPKWSDIDIDFQSNAKKLLEIFVKEDKKNNKSSIGSGLQLISVCRYLTENQMATERTVEDFAFPLEIIYIDDRRFVLAKGESGFVLNKGELYKIDLFVANKENRLLDREIKAQCSVDNVYSQNKRLCYACSFINLKEEDKRFITDKGHL